MASTAGLPSLGLVEVDFRTYGRTLSKYTHGTDVLMSTLCCAESEQLSWIGASFTEVSKVQFHLRLMVSALHLVCSSAVCHFCYSSDGCPFWGNLVWTKLIANYFWGAKIAN